MNREPAATERRIRIQWLGVDETAWETDYIREICLEALGADYSARDRVRLVFCKNIPDLEPVEPCDIAAVGSTNTVDPALLVAAAARVLPRLRPSLLLHLSDEWGDQPVWFRLYPLAPMVVRQHRHPSYGPLGTQTPRMELAYMRGMFPGHTSRTHVAQAVRASARDLAWSHIGNMKADRRQMIETFAAATWNKPHIAGSGYTPKQMADIYDRSVFVPCGRGYRKLDCFRHYEASICGAIPVVAGDADEIRATFTQENGEMPPWIYAGSWPEAVARCQTLLQDPLALDAAQATILRWWTGRLDVFAGLVRRALALPAPGPGTGPDARPAEAAA